VTRPIGVYELLKKDSEGGRVIEIPSGSRQLVCGFVGHTYRKLTGKEEKSKDGQNKIHFSEDNIDGIDTSDG
jgi:hypothetical protein